MNKLFVVIAITGILPELIFLVMCQLSARATMKAATVELAQVKAAIDGYRARYRVYPSANPADGGFTPLRFEWDRTIPTNGNGQPRR